MKAGDIALTIIPQDNQEKLRPVLILKIMPKYEDLLVCAVSSQVHQLIPDFDLLLENNNPAFKDSGLKTTSIFRLGSLAVLEQREVIGSIGFLHEVLHKKLLNNLSDYLLQ